jgi:hypothetical protein
VRACELPGKDRGPNAGLTARNHAILWLLLDTGGELVALQKQPGVAGLVSVKRYQHFCEQRSQESEAWACSEKSVFTRHSRRGKSTRRKERGWGEKPQTLLVRKEQFVESLWLWNNEEAVVPSRSQTPHELIRANVSRGFSWEASERRASFDLPPR